MITGFTNSLAGKAAAESYFKREVSSNFIIAEVSSLYGVLNGEVTIGVVSRLGEGYKGVSLIKSENVAVLLERSKLYLGSRCGAAGVGAAEGKGEGKASLVPSVTLIAVIMTGSLGAAADPLVAYGAVIEIPTALGAGSSFAVVYALAKAGSVAREYSFYSVTCAYIIPSKANTIGEFSSNGSRCSMCIPDAYNDGKAANIAVEHALAARGIASKREVAGRSDAFVLGRIIEDCGVVIDQLAVKGMHSLFAFNDNGYRIALFRGIAIGGSCGLFAAGNGGADNLYLIFRNVIYGVSTYSIALFALNNVVPSFISRILSKGCLPIMAGSLDGFFLKFAANGAVVNSCAVGIAGSVNNINLGLIFCSCSLCIRNRIFFYFNYLTIRANGLGVRISHLKNDGLVALGAVEYALNIAIFAAVGNGVTGDLDLGIVNYAPNLAVIHGTIGCMNVEGFGYGFNYGNGLAVNGAGVGYRTFFLAGSFNPGYGVVFKSSVFDFAANGAGLSNIENFLVALGAFLCLIGPGVRGNGKSYGYNLTANGAVVNFVAGMCAFFTSFLRAASCCIGVNIVAVCFQSSCSLRIRRIRIGNGNNFCICGLGVVNANIDNDYPAAVVAGEYRIHAFGGAVYNAVAVTGDLHALGKGIGTAVRKNLGGIDRFAVELMLAAGKDAVEFNGKAGLFVNISEVSIHICGAVYFIFGYFVCILGKVFLGKHRKLNVERSAATVAECSCTTIFLLGRFLFQSDLVNVVALRSKLFEANEAAAIFARIYGPAALADGAILISYLEALFSIVMLAGCRGDVGLNAALLAAVYASINGVALAHAGRRNNGGLIEVSTGCYVYDLCIAAVFAYAEYFAAHIAGPVSNMRKNSILHVCVLARVIFTIAKREGFRLAVAVSNGDGATIVADIEANDRYGSFGAAANGAEVFFGAIGIINDEFTVYYLHALNSPAGATSKAESKSYSAAYDAQQHKQLNKH